jgi:hypothetical protein
MILMDSMTSFKGLQMKNNILTTRVKYNLNKETIKQDFDFYTIILNAGNNYDAIITDVYKLLNCESYFYGYHKNKKAIFLIQDKNKKIDLKSNILFNLYKINMNEISEETCINLLLGMIPKINNDTKFSSFHKLYYEAYYEEVNKKKRVRGFYMSVKNNVINLEHKMLREKEFKKDDKYISYNVELGDQIKIDFDKKGDYVFKGYGKNTKTDTIPVIVDAFDSIKLSETKSGAIFHLFNEAKNIKKYCLINLESLKMVKHSFSLKKEKTLYQNKIKETLKNKTINIVEYEKDKELLFYIQTFFNKHSISYISSNNFCESKEIFNLCITKKPEQYKEGEDPKTDIKNSISGRTQFLNTGSIKFKYLKDTKDFDIDKLVKDPVLSNILTEICIKIDVTERDTLTFDFHHSFDGYYALKENSDEDVKIFHFNHDNKKISITKIDNIPFINYELIGGECFVSFNDSIFEIKDASFNTLPNIYEIMELVTHAEENQDKLLEISKIRKLINKPKISPSVYSFVNNILVLFTDEKYIKFKDFTYLISKTKKIEDLKKYKSVDFINKNIDKNDLVKLLKTLQVGTAFNTYFKDEFGLFPKKSIKAATDQDNFLSSKNLYTNGQYLSIGLLDSIESGIAKNTTVKKIKMIEGSYSEEILDFFLCFYIKLNAPSINPFFVKYIREAYKEDAFDYENEDEMDFFL